MRKQEIAKMNKKSVYR
jgi:hypothetical protein